MQILMEVIGALVLMFLVWKGLEWVFSTSPDVVRSKQKTEVKPAVTPTQSEQE